MIGGMEFSDAAGLGRNEWWRYALGLGLIVFATFFIGGVPLAVGVMVVTLDGRPATDVNRTNGALIGVSPALSLALTLLPFVMAFCAILLTARLIHRRPAVERDVHHAHRQRHPADEQGREHDQPQAQRVPPPLVAAQAGRV